MRWITKRLADADRSRGAAAVEFAIVLTVLIPIIFFGIIDFGRYFSMQQAMEQLAREGARLVALGDPIADMENRVIQAAKAADLDETHIDFPGPPVPCTAGNNAVVTVRYSLSNLILLGKDHPTGIGQMPCGG